MDRLTTRVRMSLRWSGALLIVLGLAIWTGRADGIIPLHELVGFALVLALWTLAFLAARAGVRRGIVVAGFAWGLIAPILGLTQAILLTNDWHWVIQVLHLLVGLAAIGTGEALAQRILRMGASQVKAA